MENINENKMSVHGHAAELFGIIFGLIGYTIHEVFGVPAFAPNITLNIDIPFLQLSITADDIHKIVMAAICSSIGFLIVQFWKWVILKIKTYKFKK